MACHLMCFGMNVNKLLYIALFSLYINPAQAGYGNKGNWGDDLTYNHFGFAGMRVSVLKDAIPIGWDAMLALHVTGNFFMGFNFGQDVGQTKQDYGHGVPGVSSYYLDMTNIGVNLDYVLHHDKQKAITFHLIGAVQTVSFGYVSGFHAEGFSEPYYTPSLTFHKAMVTNYYISVRPALSYTTHKVAFMAAYNFLHGISNFGKITDFEGVQLEACFSWKKAKRHGY